MTSPGHLATLPLAFMVFTASAWPVTVEVFDTTCFYQDVKGADMDAMPVTFPCSVYVDMSSNNGPCAAVEVIDPSGIDSCAVFLTSNHAESPTSMPVNVTGNQCRDVPGAPYVCSVYCLCH